MSAVGVVTTGSTGFVGSFVKPLLMQSGTSARHFVRAAPAMAGRDEIGLGAAFENVDFGKSLPPCNAVIHMAGRAHVFDADPRDQERKCWNANVVVTEKLALAAAASGVRHFVFLSTVKAFGEESARPLKETDPARPLDAYGRSKLEAERKLLEICEASDMRCTIIRSPMVYGPHCKGNIPRLANLIVRRMPLPFASIRNRRSMISVRNLADILVRCVSRVPGGNRVYCVSDGAALSTPDLIRQLGLGMEISPRLFPFPVSLLERGAGLAGFGAEIRRLTGSLELDTSAMVKDLGWRPVIDVSDGLIETGRSFRRGNSA